jgi:hypothetical protein
MSAGVLWTPRIYRSDKRRERKEERPRQRIGVPYQFMLARSLLIMFATVLSHRKDSTYVNWTDSLSNAVGNL